MATKTFQLNEIFQFLPKSHRKAGDGLGAGLYPFFTSSQLQTKWFDEADYSSEAIILGTGGAPSIHCADNFSTSADTFIIAPKDKNVLAKYVYYFLSGNKDILDRGFKGAGLRHLSKEYTEKIQIPFPVDKKGNPDFVEQQQIVDMLEEAESLKKKRTEASQKMNELIPALFVQMFGDPTANHKKFPIVELSSVCLRITDGTHQPPHFTSEGIPFLFVKNIVHGKIDFQTEKHISEETYLALTKKVRPERNDILYSTVGSYGVAVLVETDEKFSFQRHIGHLKPNHALIHSGFLCAQLNTPFVRVQADQRARGVAQKTLNLDEIRKLRILLPPIALQNQFAEKVKEIEAQKEKQKQSAIQLDVLFSSLLSRSFASKT